MANADPKAMAPDTESFGTLPGSEVMSPTRYHFNKFMEALFHRTLCPRPDASPLWLSNWAYNFTGGIASYFHKKTCERCALGNND